MDFLTVLSYEHLDNGMFLRSFARSLHNKKKRGIIIHGDSEYTERIIQLGYMRDNAVIRAVKELNHRLVALFADEGVPVVAVNGYQKSMVQFNGEQIGIDRQKIGSLPGETLILISNLAEHTEKNKPVPVSLKSLAYALQNTFNIPEITLFSIKDDADLIHKDLPKTLIPTQTKIEFKELHISRDFHSYDEEIQLTTPSLF